VSGHQLKVRRVAAKVTQGDLAAVMRLSVSRLTKAEKQERVSDGFKTRYLLAIAQVGQCRALNIPIRRREGE
jgi:transcriptional regulator with XRE-family HTH domain